MICVRLYFWKRSRTRGNGGPKTNVHKLSRGWREIRCLPFLGGAGWCELRGRKVGTSSLPPDGESRKPAGAKEAHAKLLFYQEMSDINGSKIGGDNTVI